MPRGHTEPWWADELMTPCAPVGGGGTSARILLVEDELTIADFMVRGLRAVGYAVECVFDGLEGERRALSHQLDLVILDRMLPGRDGLGVLAAIRQSSPRLPVIMVTARADADDRAVALAAGATDYLVKPFSFADLLDRIALHLGELGCGTARA